MSTSPKIVGHRGAAAVEPENTLRSFRRALADGAELLECDVHLSRDGVAVIMHDETIDRTAADWSPRRSGALAQLTRAELDDVVLDEGERIPNLADLLDLLEEAGEDAVPVYVEVKAVAAAEEVARQLVERYGDRPGTFSKSPVMVISFHPEALAAVHAAAPGIPFAYIVHEVHDSTMATVTSLHAQCLSIRLSKATAEQVRVAHDAGLVVNVWTANTDEQLRKAVEIGADTITSDDPGRALEVIRDLG